MSKGGRPENLIPNSERTPDERAEIARRGGIASGRARRLKKQLTQMSIVRRHEIEFFDDLDIVISAIKDCPKIDRQFCIGKYRIDGFIPVYNIAIEYDEEQHMSNANKKKDAERQSKIDELVKMKWVRVIKGMEIDGFRDVIKSILYGDIK